MCSYIHGFIDVLVWSNEDESSVCVCVLCISLCVTIHAASLCNMLIMCVKIVVIAAFSEMFCSMRIVESCVSSPNDITATRTRNEALLCRRKMKFQVYELKPLLFRMLIGSNPNRHTLYNSTCVAGFKFDDLFFLVWSLLKDFVDFFYTNIN